MSLKPGQREGFRPPHRVRKATAAYLDVRSPAPLPLPIQRHVQKQRLVLSWWEPGHRLFALHPPARPVKGETYRYPLFYPFTAWKPTRASPGGGQILFIIHLHTSVLPFFFLSNGIAFTHVRRCPRGKVDGGLPMFEDLLHAQPKTLLSLSVVPSKPTFTTAGPTRQNHTAKHIGCGSKLGKPPLKIYVAVVTPPSC